MHYVTLRQAGLLLVVLLSGVVFAGRADAARVLSQYDLDSLCALSELIVKAEVGEMREVKTRDGDCAVTEITVQSVLKGTAKSGATLRVAGVEEYRKGPGFDGVDPGYSRLRKGDVVYLFLAPKDARIGYAKYKLTDAEWQVVESGARLVVKDRVLGFRQDFSTDRPSVGPIAGFIAATEKLFPHVGPPVSVETFEERVQKSVRFVDELTRKIDERKLTETEQQDILRSRKAVLKKEIAAPDHIPLFIEQRMRKVKFGR